MKDYKFSKNSWQKYLRGTDKKLLPLLNLFSFLFHTFIQEQSLWITAIKPGILTPRGHILNAC